MTALLRNAALAVVTGVLRACLRVLSAVFPQSRSVVVSVFPETEGNGLEVARALVRRYAGTVVWLREGGVPAEVEELRRAGLRVVPKASLRGLVAYLRAEAVFFTHGLYGSPRPSRRKPVVNLWHGDGPKDIRPSRRHGSGLIRSTYVVSSSRLFSANKVEAFGVRPEQVLLTGNPRTDQFWRPVDRAALARLGISRDFVVWMPTFRDARAVGAVRTRRHDGAAETGPAHLRPLLDGLAERGLQLVVKPHPVDADRRRWPGTVTVTEEDLVRAGVGLYALLGCSRGLVTDYSSVWVDYLLLDRPMAFLVPDRGSYDRALLPPDVLDWVPGEVLDAEGSFAAFFAEIDGVAGGGTTRRAEVATRIGLNPSRTAADDLVTELARRGVIAAAPASPRVGSSTGADAAAPV